MKHRLIGFIALAALACAVVVAGARAAARASSTSSAASCSPPAPNSVQVQVEGGNHAALKALIGQSQNETFTTDSRTEFLGWTAGVPHVISIGDLKAGDNVQVSVRARAGSSLADIEAKPRRHSSATTATTPPGTAAHSSCTSAPSPAARPVATSRCT